MISVAVNFTSRGIPARRCGSGDRTEQRGRY